jgi:hypothetical protein
VVSFGSLLVYTFGIFLKPLTSEFHWSREDAPRAFALAAITIAVVLPLLGIALDRLAPRRVVFPKFLVLGGAVRGLSRMSGALGVLRDLPCGRRGRRRHHAEGMLRRRHQLVRQAPRPGVGCRARARRLDDRAAGSRDASGKRRRSL